MKNLLALIALTLSMTSVAGRTGRELVDFVEADRLEGDLVNNVIRTYDLRCNRPDLVSTSNNGNVQLFEIKYNCNPATNTNALSTISVGGQIENNKVTIVLFLYKK
jgi:hypothetical protein